MDRFTAGALSTGPPVSRAQPLPHWKKLLLWAALAADASALLLAVTNHISQDVAAVPLLWVVPLSLYLLSLIVSFESARWYQRPVFLRLLAVALAGMTYALAPEFASAGPRCKFRFTAWGFLCAAWFAMESSRASNPSLGT